MSKEKYKKESDLCEDFRDWATKHGFIVYPEMCGWDMLLVDKATGNQIGIQAKLQLNVKVVNQTLPSWHYQKDPVTGQRTVFVGPAHRAILVPEFQEGYADLLCHMGVEIFSGNGKRLNNCRYGFNRYQAWYREMFDWNPDQQHDLTGIIPEGLCGTPSPIQLTPWKIGALKVSALLEVQGYVTRSDISRFGVAPSRFCSSDGWLAMLGKGRWGRGKMPDFHLQHPENYARIKAEIQTEFDKQKELPL